MNHPHPTDELALTADSFTVQELPVPAISIAGTYSGDTPTAIRLVGSRASLPADLTVATGRWQARIPLLVSRWSGPPLAPPSGRYRLIATIGDADIPIIGSMPEPFNQLLESVAYISLGYDGETGQAGEPAMVVEFSAPLTEAERGPHRQAQLEREYRASNYQPMNAVFFESFYGQSAACNPRAIDQALSEARPDIARYWSVRDASVEVPPGAIALIEGSLEWWRIRGSARLIVINDWMRKRFRKRRHQTVVQTWHGTMLKKIALNRPGLRIRPTLATLRERGYWDILLSQNPYSTRIFRSAYAFFGPIWEEGYPRNDLLVRGDAATIRARLGIPDNLTIILYAPTWRDDRPEYIDHLDVAAFAATLGGGYLTLVRGHPRALRPGHDLSALHVMDVTGYPDISELFLIADALITDYSSVMFDFTVTGKPIFFFTPDFAYYRDQLRGFYFDLHDEAPGPVVRTASELIDLIENRDDTNQRYRAKYAAWQQRFNPKDDGGAATRVVKRLLEKGVIG